jgi:hypothetical protein
MTSLLLDYRDQFSDFLVFLSITCGEHWEAVLVERLSRAGNDFGLGVSRGLIECNGFSLGVSRGLIFECNGFSLRASSGFFNVVRGLLLQGFSRVNDSSILNCTFVVLTSFVLRYLL